MDRNTEAVLDEYLVMAAQRGSADAFRRLVQRWSPRLLRHGARVLLDVDAANDAVQDTWLAIARGLRRLDDPSRFPAWAFAITTRKCVDEVRRRQRRRALTRSAVEDPSRTPATSAFDPPDLSLDLAAALASLPVDQRLMFSLFYGEGLSGEAIAHAFNIPPGTVKSRLHAIRLSLRSFLEGENHVPA
jgi:RNA polymerase sigma-70 factor (ECF subfamily)